MSKHERVAQQSITNDLATKPGLELKSYFTIILHDNINVADLKIVYHIPGR